MPQEPQSKITWDKIHTRQIKFKFNKSTDADILEKLDSLDNKTAYIKDLIRKDIANKK